MSDCATCGHPRFRPAGHADWCERITAWLRADIGPAWADVPAGVEDRDGRCGVAGCTYAVHARCMCTGHYNRWKRHGDPLKGAPVLSPASPRRRVAS